MRPNCEWFTTRDERSFILFGEPTSTRRFECSVFPDGNFGLAILAVFASDSASDSFTAYQLNDESCEPEFIEVTEEAYIMPAGLSKFGCYKFGKARRTIVRVSKPVAYLEG